MNTDLFSYLQRLESLAFFSGYPLVYALVFFIAGKKQFRKGIMERMVIVLPFAYALVGLLFLGLQLKNLYPDYSIDHIRSSYQNLWLTVWGLLSLFFWIPAIAKRPVLSLFHSLFFFFFVLRDLFFYSRGKADKAIVKNNMNVYTDSIILILLCLLVLLGLSYIILYKKKGHS